MQLIKSLSKSKVARIVALALVLAGAVSFQQAVRADIGDGDRTLAVVVYEGDPINDERVAGADVEILGGPNDGLKGDTDDSGMIVFHISEGQFTIRIRHEDYYTKDYPVNMNGAFGEIQASLVPKENTNPPPSPTPPGSECTPTPPRGRPMLNIWPISTSGADCTDYPLLSVKNVTQGGNWVSGTSINANAGDTLRVELYVHNGTLDYPENVARNVMVKGNIDGDYITAEAWADNADRIHSAQKGGNVRVNLGNNTMSYVSGSAKLYDRNMANERGLSDSVVNGGASIGNMRGCFEYLHFVTFDLKVNAPIVVPPTPPAKATLKVVKQVVGGTIPANDFDLYVGNQKVNNGQSYQFDPGIYYVQETNKPNYTAAFSGECGHDGRINLASNDNKVCTITNTFHAPTTPTPPPTPGTISLTKNVRNVSQGQTVFTPSTAAKPGEQVEFQMTVSNSGNGVDNVILSDSLPSRLVYIQNSLTLDGQPSGNSLGAINLGGFHNGQVKHVIIRATVAAASQFTVGSTTLTNTANVTSSSNSASATANVVVTISAPSQSVIKVDKTARNITQSQSVFTDTVSANPGDIVQFKVYLTVTGNTGAQSVVVTDTLPNNMDLVSGSSLVHNLGTIAANTDQTLTITAAVKSNDNFSCGSTTLTNNVSVVSTNAGSDSDTAKVNVTRTANCGGGGSVSMNINKTVRNVTQNQTAYTDSASANPGDTLQFQIQVTPSGNVNNVVVTDTLPSNVSLSSGNLTNNLGNINSTQTVLLTVVVGSDANFSCGSTTLTNTATATASNTSTVSDNANVTVNRSNNCGGGGGSSPFLTLTKEVRNVTKSTGFSNQTIAVTGEVVEFRLVVRNTGNAAANNVRVTDSLPGGLTYIPGTFQIDSGTSSGSLFNGNYQHLGTLFSGSSRTMLFQASVNSNATQTLINQATAISDNSNSANAQATVFVSSILGGNIDLVLSKSAWNQTRNVDATSVTAQAGDVIVYTLRVRNQGNATATNYVFTDDISDVLQLSRLHTFDGAAFDMSRLTLTWPSVSIAAGTSVDKTFSVVVNGAVGPNVDNIMTNVFGNTINVRVPRTAGFVAPPTGTGTAISLGLAFATMVGFWTFRKEKVQSLIKSLTHKNV